MVKKEQVISERFSFEGWELNKLLAHNAKTLKEIVKWGVGAGAGWLLTKDPTMTVPIALGSKFVLDSFEFWLKKYTKK